jgi:hypothetical protein
MLSRFRIVLALIAAMAAAPAAAATLSLRPSADLTMLTVGDRFTVEIVFDDGGGAGLTGLGVDINFDETVVAYDFGGTRFNANFQMKNPGMAHASADVRNLNAALSTMFFGTPIAGGDAVLATLSFEAVGAGATAIAFTAASTMVPLARLQDMTALNPTLSLDAVVSAAGSTVIPLPATLPMLLTGLGGLAALRRRRG